VTFDLSALAHNRTNNTAAVNRIVGGEIAKPHSYPYQAGILVRVFDEFKGQCGGSIIGAKTILTAAHCLDLSTESVVILGAHELQNESESTQQRQIVEQSGYRIHKDYDSKVKRNDIALLILPKSVTFNEYVTKIDLPWDYVGNHFVNSTVTMTGWGVMSDDTKEISSMLRFTFNKIINNTECGNIWKELNNNLDVHESNICNSAAGGKSSCGGDSGGPLTTTHYHKLIQIGLVAYGSGLCEDETVPSVNTRITSFLSWIRHHSPDFPSDALLTSVPKSNKEKVGMVSTMLSVVRGWF
jgi:secreted trypsin-like serine protease